MAVIVFGCKKILVFKQMNIKFTYTVGFVVNCISIAIMYLLTFYWAKEL